MSTGPDFPSDWVQGVHKKGVDTRFEYVLQGDKCVHNVPYSDPSPSSS